MFSRKECKALARTSLRKHYVLFVFLCLVAAVIGTSFTSSYNYLTEEITNIASSGEAKAENGNSRYLINDAISAVMKNNNESKNVISKLLNQEESRESTFIGGHIEIGHMDGVLAGVVNEISSGAFIITLLSSLYSVLGSSVASAAVLIILAFAVVFALWAFIINVYKVIYARMFMEARIYRIVPAQRLTFLIYVRKWRNVSLVMLIKTIYYCLWYLTIVGGIIKHFSYFAVPYIAAENPGAGVNEAVSLSRRMMNGHKWECFKICLTFIGWDILNIVTFSLSGILYSNPYKEAVFCEYYVYIRKCALQAGIEGAQILNDRYLFELPSDEVLEKTYGSAESYSVTAAYEKKGFAAWFCDFFGVYFSAKDEEKYAEYVKQNIRYSSVKNILAKEEYGRRFLMIPEKKRFNLVEHLYYNRRYSVWSLILMYAIFSGIGWIWEVTLHFVQYGNFVNRGVLYGPWLPIYGSGGVLILLMLNKLRTKPVAEFFSAIVLCGFVEYFIGLTLELTHGGQKWWSYDGFFLNIDGRVCAEGLLVFGIGGMIIVYLIAPLMDNMLRKIPKKAVIAICVVFLTIFTFDNIYSSFKPNAGEGITSFNDRLRQNDDIRLNT